MRILLILLLISTQSFASDPEQVPLLRDMDRTSINSLEQLVIVPANVPGLTLEQRTPEGILQPLTQLDKKRAGLGTFSPFPREILVKILQELTIEDLWRVRLVNNYFHLLVTTIPVPMFNDQEEAIIELLPIGEERIRRLAMARLNRNENLPGLEPAALVDRLRNRSTVVEGSRLGVLLARDLQEKLETYAPLLWRMRYLPGMNREHLKGFMIAIGAPTNNGFLEDLDARRLAQPYQTRLRGVLTELGGAAILAGLTAGSLSLIWTMPGRTWTTCDIIYVFPAKYLTNFNNDIADRLMTSFFPMGPYITAYLASLLPLGCGKKGHRWIRRQYGQTLTYREMQGVIETRDQEMLSGPDKICAAIATGIAPIAVLIPSIIDNFITSPTVNPTGNVTMARYIHLCLKYGLNQNASCCSSSTDGYIAGGCPLITGNGITNFDEIIATATPYTGVLAQQALNFTITFFQMLFVWYCLAIKLF